jgi:hypothetical protein
MGERKDAYRVLAGRSTRNRPLGVAGGIWQDNIKIDLEEVG